MKTSLLAVVLLLSGCTGLPSGVEPVEPFALDRYLGTWYEIARLDHRFERGLESISATYTLRADGGVKVLNRGFNPATGEWKDAEGKAYFVGHPKQGHLKVSFFGPFYGSYVVFGLDQENYQYAFVAGPNHDYLWLLARTPTVSEALLHEFIDNAQVRGFDTEQLIFPAPTAPDL